MENLITGLNVQTFSVDLELLTASCACKQCVCVCVITQINTTAKRSALPAGDSDQTHRDSAGSWTEAQSCRNEKMSCEVTFECFFTCQC